MHPWERRLSDDERSVLLSELLVRHPELAAEAEGITSTLLAVENDQDLADEITARLRALCSSGPVSGDAGRARASAYGTSRARTAGVSSANGRRQGWSAGCEQAQADHTSCTCSGVVEVPTARASPTGELSRGETIPWRVIAAQIAPGERPARADQMEPAVTGGSTSSLRFPPRLCALGLSRARSIFGGTTDIPKEIIARGLGL